MERNPHYIVVGTVVLAATALAFLFILYLGRTQQEFDEYRVVFKEQVSGLTVGGAVRFNGIQVGEVRSLEFNEEVLVEAIVRVDKTTPIKTDTIARLEIVGFTGLAVIQFEGGTPGAQALKEVVSGIPTLQAQQSGIGLLLTGSEDIIKSVNRVLSEENIKSITDIFSNVEEITGTLADSSEDIATSLANLSQLTTDLARASDDLDRLLINLNALASGEGAQTIVAAHAAITDAKILIGDLQSVIDENRNNINTFTATGLAQVGPGVTEIRRLVRTFDNFVKQLERDPAGYLLGEPVPEYKAAQ